MYGGKVVAPSEMGMSSMQINTYYEDNAEKESLELGIELQRGLRFANSECAR